jgi:hypothetical protein
MQRIEDQRETLAGKEYGEFLEEHGFSLVLDKDGDDFSCTVFQSSKMLLAFTYQMGFGENIAVAPHGAPIDAVSIAARTGGWSLIGEVWKEAYRELHAEKNKLPYPHQLDRKHEISLIDNALREFVAKVASKEVAIDHPRFRMER